MSTITGQNKIGTKVNVVVNGAMLSKDCGSNEAAEALFQHILVTKKDPSEENFTTLYEFLNTNIRIAKEGGFEYDLESDVTYLKGFNTPVPQDILDTVEDYVENGYPTEGIVNFWKLLMANPDKRIREDLFGFINEHDFSFTDEGYLVVYKTVNYLNRVDNDLAELVSNSFIKIKDKWKKSPANYTVYKETVRTLVGSWENVLIEKGYDEADDEGMTYEEFEETYGHAPHVYEDEYEEQWVEKEEVTESYKITLTETLEGWLIEDKKEIEVLGTLDEMQKNISEISEDRKSVYTDKYSGKMRIRLGEPVQMPRSECDGDPRNECSHGLHVGATKYVEGFINSFRQYKDINESPVLVCLVNPMNVVAVPKYDNSKMRVTEYYPFARGTVDTSNGNKIQIIEQKYFNHDYLNIERSALEELLESAKDNTDVRQTAKNTSTDDRDMVEYAKILESRVLDLEVEL